MYDFISFWACPLASLGVGLAPGFGGIGPLRLAFGETALRAPSASLTPQTLSKEIELRSGISSILLPSGTKIDWVPLHMRKRSANGTTLLACLRSLFLRVWSQIFRFPAGRIQCAQRETRTPTALRPLPPQSSASTNSAIWAGQAKLQRLAPFPRGACDSAGTRTQDPLLKRQVLYRLSYGVDPSFKQKVRGKDTRFSWSQGKTRSFWVRPQGSRTRYGPGRAGAWVRGAVMSVT